jgi:hypothetical protein
MAKASVTARARVVTTAVVGSYDLWRAVDGHQDKGIDLTTKVG